MLRCDRVEELAGGEKAPRASRGGHWYRITRKATAYTRPRSRKKRKRASQ